MSRYLGIVVTAALLLAAGAVRAQDTSATKAPEKVKLAEGATKPWSNTAEFSAVVTTGNSESSTFALANKFLYAWKRSDLRVDVGALRADSTGQPINVGGTLVSPDSKTTAEAYTVNGKYRYDITERLLWYFNGGWYRNPFQGFENRYVGGTGIGYRFLDGPKHLLVGELGAQYVREERVDNTTDDYTAARAFLGYDLKINDSAKFTQELEGIANLEETADWRLRSTTSITASLTKKLAIKASYNVLYDHQPVAVVLTDTLGGLGTLPYTYKTTDTMFTTSLVVNF